MKDYINFTNFQSKAVFTMLLIDDDRALNGLQKLDQQAIGAVYDKYLYHLKT